MLTYSPTDLPTYQLLAGSSEAFRVANRLVAPDGTPLGPADFGLLRQSSCSSIDGVSDTLAFEQLRASLDLAGVAQAQYEELFSIVAGLLHLGSVGFVKADAEDENCGSRPDPSSASSLAAACDLLGLPHLSERLTSRQISAGVRAYTRTPTHVFNHLLACPWTPRAF